MKKLIMENAGSRAVQVDKPVKIGRRLAMSVLGCLQQINHAHLQMLYRFYIEEPIKSVKSNKARAKHGRIHTYTFASNRLTSHECV